MGLNLIYLYIQVRDSLYKMAEDVVVFVEMDSLQRRLKNIETEHSNIIAYSNQRDQALGMVAQALSPIMGGAQKKLHFCMYREGERDNDRCDIGIGIDADADVDFV